jgi:hypothetical protein
MKKLTALLPLFILFHGCSIIDGELISVPSDAGAGFNFDYFLFIPDEIAQDNSVSLIVEPNNTGFTSDVMNDHRKQAENLATNKRNLGNFLAHELGYPLLVPVFPRGKDNWRIYTHALDRDVMLQKGNALERIDLQLLAMVADAKKKLVSRAYSVNEGMVLTGFSASGTFANRFTALHPDKVSACIGGGLNGILLLPVDSIDNTALNYPLGTNDFYEITGRPFDSLAFKHTPQFLFMGELDDNDAASYHDAYDDDERALIYKVLGEQMQPDRWNRCMAVYKKHAVHAELKTYKGIGHEPSELIKKDVLVFVKEHTQH